MMKTAKSKNMDIDWDILDKHWSNAYEADYGHLFSDTSFERMSISLPTLTASRVRIPCFETS